MGDGDWKKDRLGRKGKRRLKGRVVVEGTKHTGGHVFGKVPRVKSRIYHEKVGDYW